MRQIAILSAAFALLSMMSYPTSASPGKYRTSSAPAPVEETKLPQIADTDFGRIDALRERIQSATTLIKNEKVPATTSSLRAKRGATYFQLAKTIEKTQKAPSADAKAIRLLAVKDFEFITGQKSVNPVSRSLNEYVLALTKLDLGDRAGACLHLQHAIDLNPGAAYAIASAIYLGDDEFRKQHLDAALRDYRQLLQKMSAPDRENTLYKIAKIDLAQGHAQLAEEELMKIAAITSRPDSWNRIDPLRDLASLLVDRSDPAILAMIDHQFQLNEFELNSFLTNVVLNRLTGSPKSLSPALFHRLMQIEKRPVERIHLQLMKLRQLQGEPWDDILAESLKKLETAFSSSDASTQMRIKHEMGHELRAEIEAAISQLSTAIARSQKTAGKIAVPSSSARSHVLLTSMREQLSFYQDNFAKELKPAARTDLKQLWIDTCVADQDWTCVVEQTRSVQKDSALASLNERALSEEISALEELAKSDPRKFRPQLVAAMQKYVIDPSHPQWKAMAHRLVSFYATDRADDKALAILKSIDAVEKSEDSYYRLLLYRFQTQRWNEISQDERSEAKFQTSRIDDIRRESFLKLAKNAAGEESSSPERFTIYEKSIHGYLKVSKDPAKKILILRDYLSRLEKLSLESPAGSIHQDKLNNELTTLTAIERADPSLNGIRLRLINRCWLQGKNEGVVALIGTVSAKTPDKLALASYMAELAGLGHKGLSSARLAPTFLQRFDHDERNYVYGLIALARPLDLASFLPHISNAKADSRSLWLLAEKMKACDPPLKLSQAMLTLLGDVIPADLRPPITTAIEKKIAAVQFPKLKKLSGAGAAQLTKVLTSVKKIRAEIPKQLAQAPPESRLRILSQAVDLEMSAARLIDEAPLPAGLTPDQMTEYHDGIAQMSGEFKTQAETFRNGRSALESQLESKRAENQIPVKKISDFATWPWSQRADLVRFRQPNAILSSLIQLDYIRSSQQISEEDYWLTRAGALLQAHPCQFMVDQVYAELLAAKQDKLIQRWSQL